MIDATIVTSSNPFIYSQTQYLPDLQLEKTATAKRSWKTEALRNSRPSDDLRSAEFDNVWLARTLATFASKDGDEQWRIAKAYRTYLEQNRPPATAATLYFAAFPEFAHDKFQASKRQELNKAKKLLKPGKWGRKLVDKVPELYFYSLNMKNLGLHESYADSRFIYYTVVIEEIKAALRKHIPEPFAWKIEVGKAGNVHPHAIAPYAPLLRCLEGTKRMQAVEAGTEVYVIAYMLKPFAPWTQTNYGNFLRGRAENQASRLSPLSGNYGLGNSRTA